MAGDKKLRIGLFQVITHRPEIKMEQELCGILLYVYEQDKTVSNDLKNGQPMEYGIELDSYRCPEISRHKVWLMGQSKARLSKPYYHENAASAALHLGRIKLALTSMAQRYSWDLGLFISSIVLSSETIDGMGVTLPYQCGKDMGWEIL